MVKDIGERRIKFKTKERKMLETLMKKYKLTKLHFVGEFQVEPITIQRWLDGDSVPAYHTRIAIRELYDKCKEGRWIK